MLFGHHTFDKTMDEHLQGIAALASDPQTLVFLDTNILAYLYKLHEAARGEFFMWSDIVVAANRLAIPGWAASEYLSRVASKNLDSYTPKTKEPSAAKRALDALYETASLFVDEPVLRKIAFVGDRVAYLNGFRQAIDALAQYTPVFSHQFDPGVIHQQIVEHLSASILDSDLVAHCTRASKEGSARFEHRLPPGFRDGNKDENRFGDLIIWFEILDKSEASAATLSKVIFITNDEKSDWVYAPKMRTEIVAGARKTVSNSNPEIKLADPRLVSEFQRRTNKSANFAICSLATLVEALSKVNATQFTQLAAAIQINTQEAETSPPAAGKAEDSEEVSPADGADAPVEPPPATVEVQSSVEVPPELPPAVPPTAPVEPSLHYSMEALQDSQYKADVPSDINAIIHALKSLNWYTQNPAIVKIQTIREEGFTPSSWFVLGRNIYQAACGNSQKAMEFIAAPSSQLAQFPKETAQHLLAGILFEIYFDAHGQFRDVVKFGYADKPLALVEEPAYDDVRTFILNCLQNYHARLRFLPGDVEKKTVRIVSVKQQDENVLRQSVRALHSVTLDGVELIRDLPEADDALARVFGQHELSEERLRAKIAEDLAIPKWALINHYEPPVPGNALFVVPKERELHPKLALQSED